MNVEFKITQLKPFGILVKACSRNQSIHDINVEKLRDLFNQEQLILLRGFSSFESAVCFSNYCELWGEVSLWPFGKVLELIEHECPKDHIFDHNYVPLHWDGMYRLQVPEYQIFHCVEAPSKGQGGRTTFSNTLLTLRNTSSETKELWSRVFGRYQRKMEFYNSKVTSPIITQHPFKRNISVIRYNEPVNDGFKQFLNPPDLDFGGVSEVELEKFHHGIKSALYNKKNFYAHEWQKGDIVIADNFSLLHGREKFESKASRHIQRVQVLSEVPYNNPGLESYHQ